MLALKKINSFVSNLSASAVVASYVEPKYNHCSVFTDNRNKLKFNHHPDCVDGRGYVLTRKGLNQEIMNIKVNMLVGLGELKFLLNADFDCKVGSSDGLLLGKVIAINEFSPHQATKNGEPTVAVISASQQKQILTVIKKGLQGKGFTVEQPS